MIRAHAGLRHRPERRARARHHALGDHLVERAEHDHRHVVAGVRAAHHRGGEPRVQEAALRRLDPHRPVHALVVRQGGQERAAHGVGRHRVGVGEHAVDGARLGRGRARVVGHDLVARHGESDPELVRLVDPVGAERVAVRAVGHGADGRAHRALRAAEQLAGQVGEPVEAVVVQEPDARGAPSGRWRPPAPRCRPASARARARSARSTSSVLGPPCRSRISFNGGICSPSSKISRMPAFADAPADVGHVRDDRGEGDEAPVVEDRHCDVDVVDVAGAHPRVVGDHHVAGLQRRRGIAREEVLDRRRQRADERRDAAPVCAIERPSRVGQHAREVVGLAHQHRERRAHERGRGLVDDGDEPLPLDFQRDGSRFTLSSAPHSRVPDRYRHGVVGQDRARRRGPAPPASIRAPPGRPGPRTRARLERIAVVDRRPRRSRRLGGQYVAPSPRFTGFAGDPRVAPGEAVRHLAARRPGPATATRDVDELHAAVGRRQRRTSREERRLERGV